VTVSPSTQDLNYVNSAKIVSVRDTLYSTISETTYHFQQAPTPISDQITGSKILLENDQVKEFGTGTFKVSIRADQSNDINGYDFGNETVEVNGDGSFTFTPLTFTKKGTYIFIVTEEDLKRTGYSYDGSIYRITYEVANENGALKFQKEITKDDELGEKISFTNTYKKPTPPNDQVSDPSSPKEVVSPHTGNRSGGLKWLVVLIMSLTLLTTFVAVRKITEFREMTVKDLFIFPLISGRMLRLSS
jgi:pilin isopeptide linkage protein